MPWSFLFCWIFIEVAFGLLSFDFGLNLVIVAFENRVVVLVVCFVTVFWLRALVVVCPAYIIFFLCADWFVKIA